MNTCRFASIALAVGLASCVVTKPTEVPPNVNLSPESVFAPDSSSGGFRLDSPGVTIGVETAANESDSLDNLEVLPGVRVARVARTGPGAAAGLRAGDVVLAVGAVETNDPDAFQAVIREASAGSELSLRVRRETTVFEATVVPAVLPATAAPPRELHRLDPVKTRAGYRTEIVRLGGDADQVAARVVEIYPRSPLPDAGIVAGDLVVAIDGSPIDSAQGLVRRLTEEFELGQRVVFDVARPGGDGGDGGGETRQVDVELFSPPRRLARLGFMPLFNYESELEPSTTEFSLLDFWLFAVFSYKREQGEREYRVLHFIHWTTGYGELIEE